MEIGHDRFNPIGRPRIAQLINKSNQFNLTTRRYSVADVEAAEVDPRVFTLQTRLSDRFGGFGTIGVIIARSNGPASWMVDTWVMSCRVLGRRVEEAMLAELVAHARARGIAQIRAQYLPTGKNGMVSEHFDKLGFSRLGESVDGVRDYELVAADYAAPELPFATAVGEVAS